MPRKERWSLPGFAIARPVTVWMIVLTCVVVGIVAWSRLPLEFIIQLWRPTVWVRMPYPGATPAQVEQEITIPAEGILKTIPNMEYLRSYSDSGQASFRLGFAFDADMALASAEIRDRVERLKPRLPEEVDHVFLSRFSPDDIPIMHLALFREEEQDALALYARTHFRNRLLRVPGVADVRISGRAEAQIYVNFNQDALRSAGLNLYQVAGLLQSSSVNVGLGRLRDGRLEYLVRVRDEFATVRDLEATVIGPTGLRLSDVADIETSRPSGADSFSVDGKRGVFVTIIKESGANSVDTCDGVRAELVGAKDDPELRDAEFFVFDDQSDIIRTALGSLFLAGQYGCVMAFLVLWVFLRRIQVTLLVALAIPASLMLAPAYIYFSGRSLNLITITAMFVSVGILVDNAIVVVENIHRHQAMGKGLVESAKNGAREVSLAITAATLTTLVVFVPVFYMNAGELSSILKEFAGPITFSLLGSLVLALTVLPMAESRLGPPKPGRVSAWYASENPFARTLRLVSRLGLVSRMTAVYRGSLVWVMRRRAYALLGVGCLLFLTWWLPFRATGFRELPEIDLRTVSVNFRVDQNYGYDNAMASVEKIADIINLHREELGIANLYVNSGGWGGELRCYLAKAGEAVGGNREPPSTEAVRLRLRELLPERVAGGRIDCGIQSANPDGDRSISVELRGDDTKTLEEIAEQFRAAMATLPNLSDVTTSVDDQRDEIQLRIDDVKAAHHGVSPSAIARSVSTSLSGTRLPYLKKRGREVPVWGRVSGEDRKNAGDLEVMTVEGRDGQSIPLMQMVELRKAKALARIQREEARTIISVSGRTDNDNMIEVKTALSRLIARFDLPSGYSIRMDEQFRQMDQTMKDFNLLMLTAFLLIYLLLAALFESWLLPLSVLTTVPMAFVGVYWALYMTNTALDTIALTGAVILCGLIVNNGIVIVDHMNQLRREGTPRAVAVIEGGLNRLRPVMMTTLTTILGVLPLAMGGPTGGATGVVDGLGRGLVGGLVAGTFLTLYVVPLMYTVVDDFQAWCRDFLGGFAVSRVT